MNKLKIKKIKEKKLVGIKFRYYVDFIILACCIIIAFNINPSNHEKNKNTYSNKYTMTYIFHDYEGNEYVMNDKIHGAPNSWDYLFNDDIPNNLKGEDQYYDNSVSLGDFSNSSALDNNIQEGINSGYTDGIKDNQVSFDDIMNDLGIENGISENSESDSLVITIEGDSNEADNGNNNDYIIKEQVQSGNTLSLVIEKVDDSINNKTSDNTIDNTTVDIENNNYENDIYKNEALVAKSFTFTKNGWILPVLVSRSELTSNKNTITYINADPNGNNTEIFYQSGIIIIGDYADCITPWGYKIHHGDSVLAYQQMNNAPDICNIERRFCWKGKLSGTYTQQGCSVNKNYTYEQWGDIKVVEDSDEIKGSTRQNSDGSVTVKNSEIGGSFVFDRPNNTYSDFKNTDNIRIENQGVEQTSRPHPNCTTPRGESVKHGQFVQAFKHANGFSDVPCEIQIRLCSLGELMGTYTESTCKTRDTSFIDRVNGSKSRDTYSKEKIERVKKQIINEDTYYENARENAKRSTNSDALDRILYILDQD